MAAELESKTKGGSWKAATATSAKGSKMATTTRRRRTTKSKVNSKVKKAGVYAGKTAVSTGIGTVISHSRRRGKRKRASWLTLIGVVFGGVAEVFGDTSKTHIQLASAMGQGAAAAGLGDAIAERAIEASDEMIDDEEEFIDELPDADHGMIDDGMERRRVVPQTRYSEDQGA